MDFPGNKRDRENNESRALVPIDIRPASDSVYDDAVAPPAGLFEYGRLMLRRKGVLLIAAVLGTGVGLLISMPRTRIYQAHTTLEIQGLNENLLNTRDINPSVPSGSSNATEEIQTQIRILQSESLNGRVINKLGVQGSFIPLTRLARLRAALGLSKTAPGPARDAAIIMAAQTLQIEGMQQARIITILCDSTDPEVAADFLNTLTNEFIDQKLDSRINSSQRTATWLNRQLDEIKVNLEKSDEKLQEYALSAGLMFTTEKDSSVDQQKLQQLQSEISAAQADRVIKQSKYEIASAAPPESLPQVLDDVSLRTLQAKLAEMRGNLAELNISLTPEHYRVQRLQAQIDELQGAFDHERANIIKRISNEYDDAKRREELLLHAYTTQANLVSEQAGRVAHYEILKREVESNRALYEAMTQRVKEYGMASAVTANNVRIIDIAQAPSTPYKPDVYMYTVLGTVTGLFLGILLIVRQEHVDRSIHAPGEAAAYLKVPELGVVLSAEADATFARANSKKFGSLQGLFEFSKRVADNALDGVTKSGPGMRSKSQVELMAWERRGSLFAECFRSTAASLLFTEPGGRQPQTLVITSCSPQDGKSTSASNLAAALAETKRRVLVIDADLRRPHLHSIFQIENRWGLIDILQADIEIDEYPLDMLAQETSVPNVYITSSGTPTESIVHLLHSARLPELLRRFRREFDIVLVDAPPVGRIADARVLARLCDGVIFVLRSGKTTRDMAVAACRQFAEDGSRVFGTILNMWDPRDSNLQDYSQYHDEYYQYYAKK